MPRVCAHKTQCTVKKRDPSETATEHLMPTTCNNKQLLDNTSTTGVSEPTTMTISLIVILYAVIGVLVLIIILLLLVIMAFTVHTVKHYKANEDKQGGGKMTTTVLCTVLLS